MALLDRLRGGTLATPDGERVRPLESLVASAARISGRKIHRTTAEAWQDEAWTLYDATGELRFVANSLANGMSRARVFAAKLPVGDEEPQPIDLEPEEGQPAPSDSDRTAAEAVGAFAGGSLGRAEVVRRLALQLFVPGDGWIAGLPPGVLDTQAPAEAQPQAITPQSGDRVALSDLTWHAFAVGEVRIRAGVVALTMGDGAPAEIPEDQIILIRVWRPHPRKWWMADSPVKANMSVLRELLGLTRHVGAAIDSRLAGAGLLVLPQSVEVHAPAADNVDNPDAPVPGFVDALMDAMLTPIQDRDSAAAVVPLVIRVPDEVAAQIDQDNLIRFSTPFDERTKELRDEAIRRLALGLDAPAEVLLGMSTANHWGAWQIDEATVKTHIEPVLALICDALTTQYLWPVLQDAGVADWRDYVVWFDTVDLTLRPNRTAEATALYDKGELTGAALRREAGFSDEDAPPEVDQPVRLALDMVAASPSLLSQWRLADLVAQIRAVVDGTPPPDVAPLVSGEPAEDDAAPADDDEDDEPDSGQELPDTRDDEPLAAAANGHGRRLVEGPALGRR